MTNPFSLIPISTRDDNHRQAIAGLWTGACGEALAVSPAFVAQNLQPTKGALQSGRLALLDDEPVGFVVTSVLPNEPSVIARDVGWINAIAVLPEEQRRGVGTLLMEWAEAWLLEQSCSTALVGSSLRPFVPGVPQEVESTPFFAARGFETQQTVWDVASNLAMYAPPRSVRAVEGTVRPMQPGDEIHLLGFLRREFGGRWRYEFEQFLLDGGRASDYMLLWTERGVDGFCQLTFEDSLRSLERFFPYQLPRPWGQLGPIGVSADKRGQSFGAAILDAGLRRLHNNGVNGCVIDWTTLTDFYGKFGFKKYRAYTQMRKQLGHEQNANGA